MLMDVKPRAHELPKAKRGPVPLFSDSDSNSNPDAEFRLHVCVDRRAVHLLCHVRQQAIGSLVQGVHQELVAREAAQRDSVVTVVAEGCPLATPAGATL